MTAARRKSQSLALMPGAFNPLHKGHLLMKAHAESRLQRPVVFELSMSNVDKPPLQPDELESRLQQFKGLPIWITQAPTFLEKSRLFPRALFVVGSDTILRIGSKKYYDNSQRQLEQAIAEIAALECRFLVFGRKINDQYITLNDLAIHSALLKICDGVPESQFRVDISSTNIRGRQNS